jgi:hypothetical protein
MGIIDMDRKAVGTTLLGATWSGVIVGTIGLVFGYRGPGDLPTESWTPRLHHMPQSFYVSTPGSASAIMVDRSGFTWR